MPTIMSLTGLTLCVLVAAQQTATRAHADGAAFALSEIAPGLFIHPGGSVREARAFLVAIRARTPLPIRYVINTHLLSGNSRVISRGNAFMVAGRVASRRGSGFQGPERRRPVRVGINRPVGVTSVAGSEIDINKLPSNVLSVGSEAFSHTRSPDLSQSLLQYVPFTSR